MRRPDHHRAGIRSTNASCPHFFPLAACTVPFPCLHSSLVANAPTSVPKIRSHQVSIPARSEPFKTSPLQEQLPSIPDPFKTTTLPHQTSPDHICPHRPFSAPLSNTSSLTLSVSCLIASDTYSTNSLYSSLMSLTAFFTYASSSKINPLAWYPYSEKLGPSFFYHTLSGGSSPYSCFTLIHRFHTLFLGSSPLVVTSSMSALSTATVGYLNCYFPCGLGNGIGGTISPYLPPPAPPPLPPAPPASPLPSGGGWWYSGRYLPSDALRTGVRSRRVSPDTVLPSASCRPSRLALSFYTRNL